MAGRTSRSPAGLHATSPLSPSSRIEDVLNMHPVPSPRAQRLSAPNHPPGRRSLYSPLAQPGHTSVSAMHGDGLIGNGVGGSRSTPILQSSPTSRSVSRAASSGFVPRVVRGTIAEREASTSSTHGHGIMSTSPTNRPPLSSSPRARRPSNPTTAAMGMHRTASAPSSTSTIVPPPSQLISFPRPSYLEHSALRYCIQSEPTQGVPPDRYRFESVHASGSVRTATISARRTRDLSSSSRDTDSDEESNASTGDRGRTVPPRLAQRKPAETVLHLPTRWSEGDRCPSLSVSVDGRELTFHGPNSGGDKDAAAARTNFPIPAACGIYYYEIEILSKGQKGHISIGFGTDTVRLSRLPGWEGQSWGYHGDDGNSFASEREGSPYGPKFTTGDTVGCGIDYSLGQAFFTKNGRYLELVFENLGSAGDLYPSVGLRTLNESIRANFGQEQFKFDIDTHVEQMRNRMWARIQSTPVAWSVRGDAGTFTIPAEDGSEAVSTAATTSHASDEAIEVSKPINELILAYLAHHGYAKTARAFESQCDHRRGILPSETVPAPPTEDHPMAMEMDEDDGTPAATPAASSSVVPSHAEPGLGVGTAILQGDTIKRQKIVHSIVDGDIDTALEDTRTHYPSVLERTEGLILFKLRCRKFVELVLEAAAVLRKGREEEVRAKVKDSVSNGVVVPDGESMEVDDDSSINLINGNATEAITPANRLKAKVSVSSIPVSKTTSQLALERALANGQALQADYKSDARPEVQAIYKRTLSLVAYEDPLADDPSVPEAVKEMAGQSARDKLAEEVNRAILESQGKPPHPALERMYRQTQACVMQLGWLGVGSAAFADMPKEFLDA